MNITVPVVKIVLSVTSTMAVFLIWKTKQEKKIIIKVKLFFVAIIFFLVTNLLYEAAVYRGFFKNVLPWKIWTP